MSRTTKIPFPAASTVSGGRGGTAQGLRSPAPNGPGTLKVANRGQGTKTYKGVSTRAQVTGLKKGGSKSVSGGKVGKVSKG